jgi:hypothetical protein
MSDSASSLTRTIARQYDLFQASLEFLQKDRKFLNCTRANSCIRHRARRPSRAATPEGSTSLTSAQIASAPVMMTKSGVLMSALGSAWCCA